MSNPHYAEALRLIRKHMQPGDTLGMMFMRVARELEQSEAKQYDEMLATAVIPESLKHRFKDGVNGR